MTESVLNLPFPDQILNQLKRVDLAKGTHFVKSGDAVKTLAFIVDGYLRTYQIDFKGNDVTTNFHKPNEYCASYYGFYAQKPALDNIVAITDVTLYTISHTNLMALFEHDLSINIEARKIIEQVCIEKDFRIAQLLKLDGKDRYLWFLETYPSLIKVAQLNHIASFLGLSPETLSRIRRKLFS